MSLDEMLQTDDLLGRVRTNVRRVVINKVQGQVANPIVRSSPYRIGRDGILHIVPGTGGISLNQRVGDPAVGLAGDHVEPGAALHNNDREVVGPKGGPNRALMMLSCIGNRAVVTTGPAQGSKGTVVGKHGGIDHVIVDFDPSVLKRLRIGDRIEITAQGQGLKFAGFDKVSVLNTSPRLLARMGLRVHGRHLHVPVSHVVPAGLLGSGVGKSSGVLGDTDIQLSHPEINRRHRLNSLRYGDLVAICPVDNRFGPSVRPNSVTIGVIVHSDSYVAGHGPGVTPLLIGPASLIKPTFSADANVAMRLGLRERIARIPAPDAAERRRVWRRVCSCEASTDALSCSHDPHDECAQCAVPRARVSPRMRSRRRF